MNRFATMILLSLAVPSFAQSTQPTSRPAEVVHLVSPDHAKVYIGIGRSLLGRWKISIAAARELPLTAEQKKTVDTVDAEMVGHIEQVLKELQSGTLPEQKRVMSVPEDIKSAHRKIMDTFGPELTKQLRDRIDSPRTRAAFDVSDFRLFLADAAGLNLTGEQKTKVEQVLADIDAMVGAMPGKLTDATGPQHASELRTKIRTQVWNQVLAVLDPSQQKWLKKNYRQLQ